MKRPFIAGCLCSVSLFATLALEPWASFAGEDKIDALNRSLMEVAEKGNSSAVKALLEQGADPNARVRGTRLDATPLHHAIDNNHRDAAEALLQGGANPYLEDDNRDAVLVFAADPSHEAVLKLLLDWKVPIDSKNSDGMTVLMRKISYASSAEIKLLLDHGADPNQHTEHGVTPLMMAATLESGELANILIKGGAQVDAQDERGNTALMECAQAVSHGAFKPLIDAGANVNLANRDGITPLMEVIGFSEELDRLLLDHGADINAKTRDGSTTLMLAAERGALEALKMAITKKVDVNARNDKGVTALHFAAMYAWLPYGERTEAVLRAAPLQMIAALTQAGADLKSADAEGLTALHYACRNGYSGTVKLLLEKGLDQNRASKEGLAPLHLAVLSRLAETASEDALEKVRLLLAGGATLDATDGRGHTPLWLAVAQMDRQLVTFLLENGASAKRVDKAGDTLLTAAARSFNESYVPPESYAKILKELTARVKNLEMRDSSGMSPLMWAAASDSAAAVEMLIARHADVNARAKDGRTPLMWAAAAGAAQAVGVLLQHGADRAAKDTAGRTALDWAEWMDQKEALDVLHKKEQ